MAVNKLILPATALLVSLSLSEAKGGGFYSGGGRKFTGFGSLWTSRVVVAGLVSGAVIGRATSPLRYDSDNRRLYLHDPVQPLRLDDTDYWTDRSYHRQYWENRNGPGYNRSRLALICEEAVRESERGIFADAQEQVMVGKDGRATNVTLDPYLYVDGRRSLSLLVFECDRDEYTYCCGMDCCDSWRPWETVVLVVFAIGLACCCQFNRISRFVKARLCRKEAETAVQAEASGAQIGTDGGSEALSMDHPVVALGPVSAQPMGQFDPSRYAASFGFSQQPAPNQPPPPYQPV